MCCAQPRNEMVFNVLIALSAAFLRWHPAGANWTVMFSSVSRNSMRSVNTSFLRMWNVGCSPAAFSFLIIVVTALIWMAFFHFLGVLRTHHLNRNCIRRGYTPCPWCMVQETNWWVQCTFFPLPTDRKNRNLWFFLRWETDNCMTVGFRCRIWITQLTVDFL